MLWLNSLITKHSSSNLQNYAINSELSPMLKNRHSLKSILLYVFWSQWTLWLKLSVQVSVLFEKLLHAAQRHHAVFLCLAYIHHLPLLFLLLFRLVFAKTWFFARWQPSQNVSRYFVLQRRFIGPCSRTWSLSCLHPVPPERLTAPHPPARPRVTGRRPPPAGRHFAARRLPAAGGVLTARGGARWRRAAGWRPRSGWRAPLPRGPSNSWGTAGGRGAAGGGEGAGGSWRRAEPTWSAVWAAGLPAAGSEGSACVPAALRGRDGPGRAGREGTPGWRLAIVVIIAWVSRGCERGEAERLKNGEAPAAGSAR